MMSGRRYLRAPLRVTTVVAMWAGSAAAKDEALETEAAPTETIAPPRRRENLISDSA
jgi:hypothetical protein